MLDANRHGDIFRSINLSIDLYWWLGGYKTSRQTAFDTGIYSGGVVGGGGIWYFSGNNQTGWRIKKLIRWSQWKPWWRAFWPFIFWKRCFLIHHEQEDVYGKHKHPSVGVASALALAGHSFLDGVGIGLGFQISPGLGILIAVAVIAHDFSDGLNTVSMALMHKNTNRKAYLFLILDAIAPVLGAISTLFYTIPQSFMLLLFRFLCRIFIVFGGGRDFAGSTQWTFFICHDWFDNIGNAIYLFGDKNRLEIFVDDNYAE